MARPKKRGLEYFPMDVDMFSDIKLRKLIRCQGGKAVTVYVCLLCIIYESGYYIRWDEDLLFIISERTGYEEAYIQEVLKSCLAVGLFDKATWADGVLTSRGIQYRYMEVSSRRTDTIKEYSLVSATETRVNATETRVSATETRVNATETRVSATKTPQSKEKKSKENTPSPPPRGAHTRESTADDEQMRWYLDLANDQSFIETVAVNMKVTAATVPRLLGVFYSEMTAKKATHNSEHDFRSHAYDWLRLCIQRTKERRNGTANRTGGAASTYEERREGVEQLLRDLDGRPEPR